MGLTAMQERGRLQENMIADITIFDANTVTDRATYQASTRPTEGIAYVLVGGAVVVEDERVQPDVIPGQAIRW